MKIHVIIATTGRSDLVRLTVGHLCRQTRPADGLLVVAAEPEDVAGLSSFGAQVEIAFSQRGLCQQRNRGLALLHGKADLIAFFDDDFVPTDNYLEEAERLFSSRGEIVGATGRIIADGATGKGYSFAEAITLLETKAPVVPEERRTPALYGCNMVLRAAALHDLWFDENLPLYGWQEDIDFTYRLRERGHLVKTTQLGGVHLGFKKARTPGRRLGYSQIANPVYLLRKRTIPRLLAWKLMARNVAINSFRSFAPESHVDRRGRLAGNLAAICDLFRGRLDPRRILDFG